ncbi:hypothetical protein J6590_024038 [Homalodisca vitripennis]|nr:hypothetical protein J6590_024038 [Homalodisca vitripennis]
MFHTYAMVLHSGSVGYRGDRWIHKWVNVLLTRFDLLRPINDSQRAYLSVSVGGGGGGTTRYPQLSSLTCQQSAGTPQVLLTLHYCYCTRTRTT